MSRLSKYMPRMQLLRQVLKNELYYTALVTVIYVVLAVMTLIGMYDTFVMDAMGWIAISWFVVSLFTMHSFSRVVRRHEHEAILQHPSAWDPIYRAELEAARAFKSSSRARPAYSPVSVMSRRPTRRGPLPTDPFEDPRSIVDRSPVPVDGSNEGAERPPTTRQWSTIPRDFSISSEAASYAETSDSRVNKPYVLSPGREAARAEDDKEKNQDQVKSKQREGEAPKLTEVRLQSEQAPQMGAYVLGIVRDGKLHLHSISETHQFRPTLTYMDILTRKTKRRGSAGSDDDSDDGPPPDPDEPAPAPAPKKEKKPTAEAKEVQVAIRKNVDDRGMSFAGGLTAVRREMLTAIRTEEDERWIDYEYCAGDTAESSEVLESIFSHAEEELECKTSISAMLTDIKGL
ncbi:hypothetical protein EIP86_002986 [Pleurotus ostreatoroseus]|nr:hypothetical protein EIP86_002986 [Pleurotus ostreatoroseus]